uniref:uncharacterized protein LOC120816476 isoform X2 n=1 Tax=Gasterosteus aculeatus aculeatus TaxID=481459 RepID=UPI001A99B600|nr:uncharacterized protein LOC120816476 isoform X2 [Gasterosteus aculeatus aculeatus]
MENCDVPVLLTDNQTVRRTSARQAESASRPSAWRQCSCCRDKQGPTLKRKRRPSAAPGDLHQKRRRTSGARPLPDHPEVLDCVPAVQPSSAGDHSGSLDLVRKPGATIPPADLPRVSCVAPSLQPSTAPLHDGPLNIFNLPVEEYQQLYHEVVDEMLRFKSGRLRPYTLSLGRVIKQKLWQRLDRPLFTETVNGDGLVHVDVSYGVGVFPPLHQLLLDSTRPDVPGADREPGSFLLPQEPCSRDAYSSSTFTTNSCSLSALLHCCLINSIIAFDH